MIGTLAAGVTAALVMGTLWLASQPPRAPRPPRRPFTLAPAWRRHGRVTRHRAAPDPGRDWMVW